MEIAADAGGPRRLPNSMRIRTVRLDYRELAKAPGLRAAVAKIKKLAKSSWGGACAVGKRYTECEDHGAGDRRPD